MIKLQTLLEDIYAEYPEEGIPTDFLQKGFRTTNPIVNPETGTISSEVEYLPAFEQVRKDLLKYRKEFQPFKYHSNESIAKSAKDLNTLLTKAANIVFALDKMIELSRK